MNKAQNKLGLLYIFIIITLLCLPAAIVKADDGADVRDYVTSRAELMKALADKKEVIYVGDIDFDENDLFIQITQSVKFVGKPEGSLFKHAYFSIIGPEIESELITVSFENITLDGCYKMPQGDPGAASSFDNFHGDRTGKGCISAKGYLDFSFTSCTIINYCTKYGAAMYFQYTDGNSDMGTRAKLTIKNSRFMNNTCERGVLWINGKKTGLYMSDCSFTSNSAYGGIAVLGGIKGNVENITVKDNNHVAFAEKNTFKQGGGGLAIIKSECILKNSVIDGNETDKGGGLMITGSIITVDSCKIINNRAEMGGGMLIESSEDAPVYITNCLISGNKADEEGAVWVWPADQIGIGVPTGITEFSFCTFENNESADSEHLVFHPIMLENENSTIGGDGKIDFAACRIMDEKASAQLVNGENYNVVNSDDKGKKIPADTVKKLANGYYASVDRTFYAGINEKEDEDGQIAVKIIKIFLIVLGVSVVGVIIFGLLRVRYEMKKAAESAGEPVLTEPENAKADEDKLGVVFTQNWTENVERTEADSPETCTAGAEETGAGTNANLEDEKADKSVDENLGSIETFDTMAAGKVSTKSGVQSKEPDKKIKLFIQKIAKEGTLTGRETDVLREYLSGKSRAEISESLYISESTVKNHISSIFAKTGVKNKKELLGLIEGFEAENSENIKNL